MKLKFIKNKTVLLLLLIFFLAFSFRYLQIKDNKIYFWYDQARDAHVARQIVENLDFKIQGPSASGTNDTIYHGVVYYYLIGPLYSLFAGNPMWVATAFSFINALSVFPLFFLVKKISKKESIGLIAAALLAFSFEHTQYSGWLSNPSLSLIPILFLYLSIWNIFYQKEKKIFNFFVMGLSMGLIQQSAFYTLYMWGSVLIGFIYLYGFCQEKLTKKQVKKLILALITYFLTIFTMILTQLKLYLAGIFNLASFASAVGKHQSLTDLDQIEGLVKAYETKSFESILPLYPILSFVLLIVIVWFFYKKIQPKQQLFLGSWFLAPLWLYVIHFRDSVHMLMGIEYVIIIILSMLIFEIFSKKYLKYGGVILMAIFVAGQINAMLYFRKTNNSIFTFQENVLLEHQLQLIDRTYQLADGEDFSISLWNTPFEYYIDWAYLYDWYGKEKYGYVPSYVGTSQVGKFGPELLVQTNMPAQNHFSIYEPRLEILGDFYQNFVARQNQIGQPIMIDPAQQTNYQLFGSYRLEYRKNEL